MAGSSRVSGPAGWCTRRLATCGFAAVTLSVGGARAERPSLVSHGAGQARSALSLKVHGRQKSEPEEDSEKEESVSWGDVFGRQVSSKSQATGLAQLRIRDDPEEEKKEDAETAAPPETHGEAAKLTSTSGGSVEDKISKLQNKIQELDKENEKLLSSEHAEEGNLRKLKEQMRQQQKKIRSLEVEQEENTESKNKISSKIMEIESQYKRVQDQAKKALDKANAVKAVGGDEGAEHTAKASGDGADAADTSAEAAEDAKPSEDAAAPEADVADASEGSSGAGAEGDAPSDAS